MEAVARFRKLPLSIMALHITAKFVFGVGMGLLIAGYFQQFDWQLFGWVLIAVSLIMSIPGAYKVLHK